VKITAKGDPDDDPYDASALFWVFAMVDLFINF